ncbi:hypothetical protein GCM10022232_45720 [Streptomyces plumbiresistens]|uniref:Uncharacterized protein n=1 Tax=Streptomyces plumbiresistens TaxID=511811 RepID=A0ABP7RTF3_9ACTN
MSVTRSGSGVAPGGDEPVRAADASGATSAIASTAVPPAASIRPRRLFGTRQRCLPPGFSREARKAFRPGSFIKVWYRL